MGRIRMEQSRASRMEGREYVQTDGLVGQLSRMLAAAAAAAHCGLRFRALSLACVDATKRLVLRACQLKMRMRDVVTGDHGGAIRCNAVETEGPSLGDVLGRPASRRNGGMLRFENAEV